jgi:nitroreductase
VHVVQDASLRAKMKKHSYLQSQVTDSSHLLVFCARDDVVQRVDEYIELSSKGSKTAALKLAPMKLVMKTAMKAKKGDAAKEWAHHQAYIALGFALAACAELGIDSCPMEGFNSEAVGKLLDVPPYMHPVVFLAIGYRSKGPSHDKTRFSKEDLFSTV